MPDVLQFVSEISASPTVLLDINDGATWRCRRFTPNPPRLRRAASNNAMRDGGFVSSSSYDMRVLQFELELITSTQDANAEQLQALARQLDKADGFIKYQPTGATKPVFFRYFRSDISQLEDIIAQAAFRAPTIEVLAEPFALGLRETLGPYTVNNDPAAGSNGCYVDLTGVIGDVPAPCVIVTDSLPYRGMLAVRQHGTPSDLTFFIQAESGTLGTDTTNPGGGPDAAMSGTGTNNYARTSFATNATLIPRVTVTFPGRATSTAAGLALRGQFKIYAVVRRSDTTSVLTMQATSASPIVATFGDAVTVPTDTDRQLVLLGMVDTSFGAPERAGSQGPVLPAESLQVAVRAARTSGAGTLDIDTVFLIPADESTALWQTTGADLANYIALDAMQDQIVRTSSSGDIFAGTGSSTGGAVSYAGALPDLAPNQTNRLYVLTTNSGGLHGPTASMVVNAHYWPRYLYVRPSAS